MQSGFYFLSKSVTSKLQKKKNDLSKDFFKSGIYT
jgi:hypothetical protein